jgi:hypothetical protein
MPQFVFHWLVRAEDQMIDACAAHLCGHVGTVRPLPSPMGNKRPTGFSFLTAKESAAAKAVFRWIDKLQHHAIMQLRHPF